MSCLLAKIGCGRAQAPNIASDSPRLNKWYVIDPKAVASSHQNKALAAYALGVICGVAGLIFGCSFVFFSFMATAGTATPVSATLGYVVALPLIYLGAWLCKKGKAYNEKAEEESRVAEIHAVLISKKEEELNQQDFYTQPVFQGCEIAAPSQETLESIGAHLSHQISSTEKARKAWLLVAARFIWICEQMKKVKKEHSYENLEKLSGEERDALYVKNWEYREAQLYPRVLQIALMAQILKDPFTKPSSLEELGGLRIKSYTARIRDQQRLGNNDYFIFHASGKAPIELDERLKIIKKDLIAEEPQSLQVFSQNFKSLQAHLLN